VASQGLKPHHPTPPELIMTTRFSLAAAAAATLIFATGTSVAQTTAENPTTPPPKVERQAPKVEKNLKVFDTLDFDVFSNQKWDRLHESHANDIVVTWPDGHQTKGIDKRIDDLMAMFDFATDIAIKTHPIRFRSGTWTSVTGVMTGTFTKPMPLPDGKSIAPTGKRFAIGMATIAHRKNGTMDREWLFWDNQDFMNQIGLGSK
jgi:SnoaL-like polyketide cyclase